MTSRIIWIDLIKVVAIFSVLLLHTASPIVKHLSKVDPLVWNIGNFYDSMVRMAVPLFFMVTGALLLNQKEESLHTFFSKRFLKVVIPLLGWSLIYILFRKYYLHQDINFLNHFFASFYKKQYYHLWFLYTLIGLYLFIPIFKIFVQNTSKTIHLYFIILWVFTVSIIPIINKFTSIHIPNYLPMMSGHIGFLLLGYMLYHLEINKKIFITSFILIIVTTIITTVGTYYLSIDANKFQSFFYKNLSLTTIIQSISYFIVLKYIAMKTYTTNTTINTIITQLSLTSFGIYLIHPIILKILQQKYIHLNDLTINNVVFLIPLTTIIVFMLSYIIIYFMRKIPLLKNLTP